MNHPDEQPTWRLREPKAAPEHDIETVRLGAGAAAPGTTQSWTAVPLVADDRDREPAGASAEVPTVDTSDPRTRPWGAPRPVTPPAERQTVPDPEPPAAREADVRTEPEPAPSPAPSGNPRTLIRFGPGVPAPGTERIAAVWHGAGRPGPARAGRRRRPAGYLAGVLVVLAVLGLLLWQRGGPPLAVRSVAVSVPAGTLGCGGTERVVATVLTNGRAGTLRYRWLRSDGTDSGPHAQRVTAGQATVRLPLRWTFQGRGTFHATARLRVTAPNSRSASASFTYRCR